MSQESSNPSIFGRGRALPSTSSEASSAIGRAVSRPGSSTSAPSFGRGSGLTSAVQSSSSSSGDPSSRGTISSSFGRGIKSEASSRETGSTSSSFHSGSSDGSTGLSRRLALAKLLRKRMGDGGMESGESQEEESPMEKTGTSGELVMLSSNWVRVALSPDKEVFQYDVQFDPSVDNRSVKTKILSSMEDVIGNIKSFDGARLWLPVKLAKSKTKGVHPNPITGVDTTVTIVYQKRTDMQKCIQLYNVLFTKCAKLLNMVMVQRNYYLPKKAVTMETHDLEIWPGYCFAAHYQKGGCMLNIDASHKVLRRTTVHKIMNDHAKESSSGNFKESVKKLLVGSVVLTRYNSRTYKIDDIDFSMNPMSTFTNRDGSQITYKDYYKNTYGFEIQDLRQPMLVHIPKIKEAAQPDQLKIIHLLPEKCFMTGLTDKMREDYRVMKDLAQHTRLSPQQRFEHIDKFIVNVNKNLECVQLLADWGIKLLDHQIDVEGRVIKSQMMKSGRGDFKPETKADWGREICRDHVKTPMNVNNWAIIYTRRNSKCVTDFVETYIQVVRSMNIKVTQPRFIELQVDSPQEYSNAVQNASTTGVQLVVIVFPFQREDRYNAVKRKACAEIGIPSQCIVSKTIMNDRKLRSVTQKIALQINCKLGGELWAVKVPLEGLMVCGVDVYHDPSRRNKSVVGFVASMNSECTRWNSHAAFQGKGEEIINCMVVALHKCILAYFRINHEYPKSILVYRDGVGDGMFDLTKSHEIPQLATVFNSIADYQPEFYYVIVQKRINTRLIKLQGGGKYGNPDPGTIMDHTITKRKYYDFLLVSQLVRQGTVTPTHYIVLRDGGLEPDKLQMLTYKMTHMYYNWPGTIRVPAPCQYAHKLAYLVGENVKQVPHTRLEDSLYFL